MWYPIINVSNTLAGTFGSLNGAVSGTVLMNGDWFWTMVDIGIFLLLILIFLRNGNELIRSSFVASLILLVLSSILFSIGLVFIVMPLIFFLLVLGIMAFSIATKSDFE